MSASKHTLVAAVSLAALALGRVQEARPVAPSVEGPVGASLHVASERVVFGEPFVLEVRCTWESSLEPQRWPPRGLEPLTVLETARERRVLGGRTVETRRYQAHALTVGPLVLDGFEFSAGSGAQSSRARAAPVELEVLSALDSNGSDSNGSDSNGSDSNESAAPERALAILGPAPRFWPWALALVGASAIGLLTMARRRVAVGSGAPIDAPEPIAFDADEDWRATLDALGAGDGAEREWYRTLNDIVRAALGRHLGLDLASATGSELLRAKPRDLDLRGFVTRADLARFADARVDAHLRAADLATARAIVAAFGTRGASK